MREVIAGSGHGNMEPLQLHFGLNTNLTANGTFIWNEIIVLDVEF